ncbi:MAG: glycogen synthase GlgA [Acidobacteria bacterium]|nr:MAG: glycogen synthase GlgA [Acidobacteriota bacterium]
MVEERFRVSFAVSEVAPYAKVGGLADVAVALPKALMKQGLDVRIFVPRYPGVPMDEAVIPDLMVPFAFGLRPAAVYRTRTHGLPVYSIDAPIYFDREGIYGPPGGEYPDNVERYAFFSRAVLEAIKRSGPPPHIIHCHDWQTGLIPLYLRTAYRNDPFYASTATLFTVHNLAYQGLFDPRLLPHLGFGPEVFQTDEGIEFHGMASALKAGLVAATGISTVSPRYAQEIQTPEFGCGLDGLLRARRDDVIGILNGVDYEVWNPETDPYIARNYGPDSLEGKKECKIDLLKRMNLPVDVARPLIGSISRLVEQKGFDLIEQAAERMLHMNTSYVVLGSGDPKLENFFRQLHRAFPDRVGVYFGFDDPLAHRIEAGTDLFLMPSRYEPCGLNQMYSLKYGTVPLVRGTGGLDDTIRNFDPHSRSGNGFKFYEYSADRLLEKLQEALSVYRQKDLWRTLMLNGMRTDFSWDRSAQQYVALYRRLWAKVSATQSSRSPGR